VIGSFREATRVGLLLTAGLFTAADLLAQAPPQPAKPFPAQDVALTRIAFGSCCKQDRPQPIWESIVACEPELFLFIGDNIYGDTRDMSLLRKKWGILGSNPGYQKLWTTCPVYAVWDDHDYGENDAGVEFPHKDESQQIFLDFFAEPADSHRRARAGLYDARIVGPPGRRVQLILLDTRYFRSLLAARQDQFEPGEGDRGPYGPTNDPTATVLGEEQWQWLAEQLQQPAEVRIIASSIQVLADGHHWETWGNFPRERQRFLELLQTSRAKGVIIISGDRHSAEISSIDLGLGYPVLDVTSSSLNMPSEWHTELNPWRVGTKYCDENFGMLVIDWEAQPPLVRAQIRDLQGKVVLQQRLPVILPGTTE
jgi:alkaline phosphatase D